MIPAKALETARSAGYAGSPSEAATNPMFWHALAKKLRWLSGSHTLDYACPVHGLIAIETVHDPEIGALTYCGTCADSAEGEDEEGPTPGLVLKERYYAHRFLDLMLDGTDTRNFWNTLLTGGG